MIFIHITWDRSQRSHSCLHSIEVDRACKHAHIHKNTHANEGTMPKLLTCAVPTGTMAACQRSLARGPTLEKIGTCASLRTVPDPVSASQQRSKLLSLTMRSAGRAPSREAHTRAFPFQSATKFCLRDLFYFQVRHVPRKLLTFSVILIETRMAGEGRVVDVGPAYKPSSVDLRCDSTPFQARL